MHCTFIRYLRVKRSQRLLLELIGSPYLICLFYRDDNDANCTYEGDNNVLLQQTSNWLMNAWREKRTSSPFGSLDFLKNADKNLRTTFYLEDFTKLEDLLLIFQSLATHLIVNTNEKLKTQLANGLNDFEAKNESQFFMARTLSLVFIQMTMFERFINYITEGEFKDNEKGVLKDLGLIYALWCLEKHLGHLYQYKILTHQDQVSKIQNTLLKLCKNLVCNAVALVDVLAPPDFILNSILGQSDGNIYQHLKKSFYSSDNSFGRTRYWNEIVSKL